MESDALHIDALAHILFGKSVRPLGGFLLFVGEGPPQTKNPRRIPPPGAELLLVQRLA
jgi:hypothetical protein